MSLLYRCECGREVYAQRLPTTHRHRHPQLDQIEADIAKGIVISAIRAKYNLDRNQAAGKYARFWAKVRYWSQR